MLSRHKRSQRIINPLRKSYRQRETDLIELLPRLNISLMLEFYHEISRAFNLAEIISEIFSKF